jgi:hypothetical protein
MYNYFLTADGPGVKAAFHYFNPDTGQLSSTEHQYLPMTQALWDQTVAKLKQRAEEEQRIAEENRQRVEREAAAREERSAQRWATFGAVMQGVAQGVAEASQDYRQSQLDQAIQQQRIQSQMQVAQRTAQVASQQASPSYSPEATRPPADSTDSSEASSPSDRHQAGPPAGPGQALRFVLMIGLTNKPGDTVNPTCYSNVITRPGPPGWGGSGSLPDGSYPQARSTVESLKAQFFAKCRASGRDIAGEGNFWFTWNDSQTGEERLASSYAHHPEDVSVSLN